MSVICVLYYMDVVTYNEWKETAWLAKSLSHILKFNDKTSIKGEWFRGKIENAV